VSELTLESARSLAEAIAGCAATVALLASPERWKTFAAEAGSEVARIRVVGALSRFVSWQRALDAGPLTANALADLDEPAHALLAAVVNWVDPRSVPDAALAAAQSCLPLLGTVEHLDGFDLGEMPTFPGVEPTDDIVTSVEDDRFIEESPEIRALLVHVAERSGARQVLLLDRTGHLLASSHPVPAGFPRAGSPTLASLAGAPDVATALRYVDHFMTVDGPDAARIAIRTFGGHASLIAWLTPSTRVEPLRSPELHLMVESLVEANAGRLDQMSVPTVVPLHDDADDPYR
jgi:hypothetical protein